MLQQRCSGGKGCKFPVYTSDRSELFVHRRIHMHSMTSIDDAEEEADDLHEHVRRSSWHGKCCAKEMDIQDLTSFLRRYYFPRCIEASICASRVAAVRSREARVACSYTNRENAFIWASVHLLSSCAPIGNAY